MDNNLGTRISAHRKRLGLTQDQLAASLGVTAQAVSKWENNQSCPDIATLPRLAEIFGVSTDELLGYQPSARQVHEAEVVDDTQQKAGTEPDTDEPHGVHIRFGENEEAAASWDFRWDGGHKFGFALATLLLLTGALLIADALLQWGVGFWGIFWPSALMCFGIFNLFPKFSVFFLCCALSGGYFLLSNLHCLPPMLQSAGTSLLLPVIIVLLGLSLLIDALRKARGPHRVKVYTNAGKFPHRGSGFSLGEDSFSLCESFGSDSHKVPLARLQSGSIDTSFGEYTVDLREVEEVADGCSIQIKCHFGETRLLVPPRFQVLKPISSVAFGELHISGQPNAEPEGAITLNASVSFGELSVQYL